MSCSRKEQEMEILWSIEKMEGICFSSGFAISYILSWRIKGDQVFGNVS